MDTTDEDAEDECTTTYKKLHFQWSVLAREEAPVIIIHNRLVREGKLVFQFVTG
jgi:hypothetical protein